MSQKNKCAIDALIEIVEVVATSSNRISGAGCKDYPTTYTSGVWWMCALDIEGPTTIPYNCGMQSENLNGLAGNS